jgi:hypothetical protein
MDRTAPSLSRLLLVIAVAIVPPASAAGQPPAVDVLANLRSPDWRVRAHAFRQIADKTIIVEPETLKTALTDLMEREMPVMDGTYTSGSSADFGEGYSEYVSAVMETLLDLATPQDTRAGELLAQSAYNDDSVFVRQLVLRFGESLVPLAVDMSKRDMGPKRWNAYGLAGELVKQSRQGRVPISSKSISELKGLLRAAATSPDFSDARISVTHLADADDATDLPLLQTIAATDAHERRPGASSFQLGTPQLRPFARLLPDSNFSRFRDRSTMRTCAHAMGVPSSESA